MAVITVPAQVERWDDVHEFVAAAMQEAGIAPKLQNSIFVAAEEIYVNIASYAYPAQGGEVTISLSSGPGKFALEFRDSGTPYNPLEKDDPDTSVPAAEREIGGLGVFMVKKMMDKVTYRFEDNMNILAMEKYIV